MNRPVHPSLRRLEALGAAPAQAVARLDRARPVLTALSRDLGDVALLSDRAIQGLAKDIDLSALIEQRLGQAAGEAHPQAEGAGDGRPSSAQRSPAGRPPKPTGQPQEMGRELEKTVTGGTRAPRMAHRAEEVAAVLERYTPAETGAKAKSRTKLRAGAPVNGTARAMPQWWGESAAIADAKLAAAIRVSPPGNAHPTPRISRPWPAEAATVLRQRAVRAGSPTAADTPLGEIPASPEVAALLEGMRAQVTRPGGIVEMTDQTDWDNPSENPTGSVEGMSRLASMLERVGSGRARGWISHASGHAMRRQAGAASSWRAEVHQDPTLAPVPRVPGPTATGLRGLAARSADNGRRIGSVQTAPEVEREDRPSVLVVERMREAEFAQRLTQLLRREARRQGIDLEGVTE